MLEEDDGDLTKTYTHWALKKENLKLKSCIKDEDDDLFKMNRRNLWSERRKMEENGEDLVEKIMLEIFPRKWIREKET